MTLRCANPLCRFDYYAMRAICTDPVCLQQAPYGCGQYYCLRDDGTLEKLPSGSPPPEDKKGLFWLCCYCSMEYELVQPDRLRAAPDGPSFVWRWQIEHSEMSVEHEGG